MKRLQFLGILFLVAAITSFIGCPMEDEIDTFMPVIGITGVPTSGTVGTPLTLTGTVAPTNATNKTIVWEVKLVGSTAKGTVNGNTVIATEPGILKVRATIANGTEKGSYMKDFSIVFSKPFVAVTGLPVSPLAGTVGTPFTLNGTVTPPNATNQNIVWTVSSNDSGTTGGTVSGNMVNATAPGTLMVMATIKDGRAPGTDFTHEVSITFIDPFVAVTGITGIPDKGTVGTPLNLTGTVEPTEATNKTIVWSVKDADTTGGTVSGNTVYTTAAGTLTVTATIANGTAQGVDYTQDFSITFPFVEVTYITGIPSTGTVGTPLTLTGTVAPTNATNKTIVWSVKDADTTGGTVSGNTVYTTAAGTLTVTAIIVNGLTQGEDYTQDFEIEFPFVQYVPVTDIIDIPGTTGIPATWTVGNELILNGKVFPENANEKDVKYFIDTPALGITSIGPDKKVTAQEAGRLTIRATVLNGTAIGTDFTKYIYIDFEVAAVNVVPQNSRR